MGGWRREWNEKLKKLERAKRKGVVLDLTRVCKV